MLPRFAIAAVFAASVVWPAGAAEPTAKLREMLSSMPTFALSPGNMLDGEIVDLGVVANLGGFQEDTPTSETAALLPQTRAWTAFVKAASWEQSVGFRRRALDGLLIASMSQGEVSVWVFKDPAVASAAFAGLPSRGFTPTPFPPDLLGALSNGDLGRMNMLRRNPADFFKGPFGRPMAVVQAGNALVFGDFSTFMHGLPGSPVGQLWLHLPPGPAGLMRGYVIASLTQGAFQALDKVLPENAVLPQAQLAAADTGQEIVSTDTGPAPADQMLPPEHLLPRYEALVLTRVELPGQWRGAALSIPFESCELANTAVAAYPFQWARLVANASETMKSAQLETTSIEMDGKRCAAVALIRLTASAADSLATNEAYRFLSDAVLNRQAAVFSQK